MQGRFQKKVLSINDNFGYNYIDQVNIWVDQNIKEFDKIYLEKIEVDDIPNTQSICFLVLRVMITENIDGSITIFKGYLNNV